jgi:hypothetical protein
MKVTLNWLKQYVDFNWSPEELTEQLIMPGLEIKSRLAATEWRQIIARSVSCGFEMLKFISPGGAADNCRTFAQFLPPLWGFESILNLLPRFAPWATIGRCSAA